MAKGLARRANMSCRFMIAATGSFLARSNIFELTISQPHILCRRHRSHLNPRLCQVAHSLASDLGDHHDADFGRCV